MLIPYGTNAPIHHWPAGTIGLIVANVAVSAAVWFGQLDADPWILQYGQGLKPIQWITSHFVHANLGHLVGNMFFLWIFGLVVEGKLGIWKFVPLYLGIGLVQSAIEQLVMLGYNGASPGSEGASAVIFGLMVIAVLWAPKNDIHCTFVFFMFYRPLVYDFEVSIGVFGAFFLGWEIFDVWVFGTSAPSALLHLSGAFLGGMVGLGMLKAHWVDCEGWDILAVFSDQEGVPLEEREAKKQAAAAAAAGYQPPFTSEAARTQLGRYLQAGNADAALQLRQKTTAAGLPLELRRDEFITLIRVLLDQEQYRRAAPLMAEFLSRYPEDSERIRLRLAQLCIEQLGRPARALQLITQLSEASLSPPLEKARRQIAARAQQMQQSGELELDDDSW